MIVCGDNALTQRLTRELASVYGEHVTVVLPSLRDGHGPQISLLLRDPHLSVRAVEAQFPDEAALREAGVERAAALALTSGDDQLNIHVALRARRLNPAIRLVIRLYNRTLGRHLEALLDRAVEVRSPHLSAAAVDASTTVLSDADTAAPSLVAAAIVGSEKIIQADGLLLRAKERTVGTADRRNPLATLALLPEAGSSDERGPGGADAPADGPVILPDERQLAEASPARGAVVLEAITHRSRALNAASRLPRLPVGMLFSRRLRYALGSLVAVVALLAAANWTVSGELPQHAAYVTLLDVFAINDPALDKSDAQQVLQLLSGLAGMLLLPLLLAVVLESYGAFRAASALPRPPRGVSGHVVLLGLGKVGTRVLDRLLELHIPVVCIDRDPDARGIALARARRVPTLVADVSEHGVLQEARIDRCRALLALTSDDATNLEAVLNARQLKPELRVAMRLFDDDFAASVYRTLRDSYPHAQTRSRSVSALAAPAFGGAMMGRQVLGAIPVGRRVLVFAAVDVAGNRLLEGRTVAEAFRPGVWRVLALDLTHERDRRRSLAAASPTGSGALAWQPHPGYVLTAGDRVVVASTRHGLGELMRGDPDLADAGAGPGAGTGPGAGADASAGPS
ncbi:NAD-binding protein [Streptomyces sp. B1866]|uniref:NAD-binding protein n=1 Tax=Streptomyces sp. B1866 TaxID=3075431 RepID=UPI00288F74D6|nr:NAD-binding protein [Streptomyces sp. B1866]MDT3396943.1 NAD-binding protein [Streptomyces sp. B1866]